MAAPQSFVPPRIRPSRPIRRFSLAEANLTLPLIKRIAADVVRINSEALKLQDAIELTEDANSQRQLQKDLEYKAIRMAELIGELTDIGAELKDPSTGLIDFVGRHNGRDVYLCWKLGEDEIAHWHDLQAGVAGRKPVSQLVESE